MAMPTPYLTIRRGNDMKIKYINGFKKTYKEVDVFNKVKRKWVGLKPCLVELEKITKRFKRPKNYLIKEEKNNKEIIFKAENSDVKRTLTIFRDKIIIKN